MFYSSLHSVSLQYSQKSISIIFLFKGFAQMYSSSLQTALHEYIRLKNQQLAQWLVVMPQ